MQVAREGATNARAAELERRLDPVIQYIHDKTGGFAVGDTDTGRTAYAYASSPHADESHKHPEKVAAEMAASAIACTPIYGTRPDYDARNWALIRHGDWS